MVSTVGKNRRNKTIFSKNIVYNIINFIIRVVFGVFLVLMILLIWTDDLYDYTNWDIALGLQLLGFLGLMVGFVLFFIKPKTSGWVILLSSVFFWVITSIFHKMLWLGPLFLIFPLLGILVLVLDKLQNFATNQKKK